MAPGQHLVLDFSAHFFLPLLPSFLPFWIDSVNSICVKRIFLTATGLRLWFVSVCRLCPLAFPLTEVSAQQLKGHCVGGQQGETGRVSVILEQGDPLQMIQLLQSPWEDRFRVSHVYFQPLPLPLLLAAAVRSARDPPVYLIRAWASLARLD